MASLHVRPTIKLKRTLMSRLRRIGIFCAGALFLTPGLGFAAPLESAPSQSNPTTQDSAAKADKPSKKKSSHVNDFLIRGTVFNEKALSFRGAQLRFRAAGQKKYRWETYTNSRGEFAVRVPQGAKYEILVRVKGFADQTRTVDATTGADEETVVFRMLPMTGGKE